MLRKLLFFLVSFNYCAGQLPNTDLWLFSLKKEKGNYLLQKAENITNREGYDNQPSFSEDGKNIYYVSIRQDKQADIYIYNTGNKKTIQFTKTPESEYSPTLTPDKKSLACVTVLKDSAQVILPYSIKDAMLNHYPGRMEDEEISVTDSIGYFTFLNADTILYYKLTKPHSLRARSLKGHSDIFLANDPVRGFKAINRYEFIYGIKDSAKVTFYRYNIVISKGWKYCEFPSLSEDIIWHKELGLLKSEGASILQFIEKENKWQTIFDFTLYGIKKITRFSFDPSNKKLVIVNNV